MQPDADAPPGIPRWLKLIGGVVVVLVVALVVLHLAGLSPGGHGA